MGRSTEVARKGFSARLVVLNPSEAGARELKLTQREILLGSHEQSDLVVRDPTVSRKHARMIWQENRCQIVDLGSTNGTFVNGRRVSGSHLLRSGDELRLGGAKFLFTAIAPEAVSGPRIKPLRALRTLAEIVLVGCVIGFATTQYLVYRRGQANESRRAPEVRSRTGAPGFAPASRASEAVAARSAPLRTASPLRTAALGRAGNEPAGSSARLSWLERLNYWRAGANLPAVKEDSVLSAGERNHARYLVKNFGAVLRAGAALGNLMHTEDPTLPWYSSEGLKAAKSSDLDEWHGANLPDPFWAIDNWMTAPFHRLSILNPGLHKVAYGDFCENGVCAAGLNVISDADLLPLKPKPLASPVEFPPHGSSVRMASLDAEWPDPLSSCPGFTWPCGLPVTLQLGPLVAAAVSAYSLSADGQKLASCLLTAQTYINPDPMAQRRGADVLNGFGAAVLVPRAPLEPGRSYTASITAGSRTYTWSFSVRPKQASSVVSASGAGAAGGARGSELR